MHSPLAKLDSEHILARIYSGESLRTIAATIGVSNVGLRAWLLREDREQYREAITAALTLRVAEADEQLDTATDAVSIARARETARFSRMDLERRRPALYGQRQQLDVTHHSYSDTLRSIDAIADAEVVSEQVQEKEVDSSEDGAG